MSRAARLSLLLVGAAAGLGAFAVLGGSGPAPADPGSVAPVTPLGPIAPRASEPAEAPAVDLAGPSRASEASAESTGSAATTVIYPLRLELSLVSRASLPKSDDVMAFRAGAIAGIEGVITGVDGQPAPGARIEFLAGPNAGTALVTDSRGRFGATDLWQGLSTVLVRVGSVTSERPVRLGRLSRTPFSVDFSQRVFVGVLVKDAQGKPVEGAEVRVDGTVSYSDSAGRAAFPAVTVGKVMTSVRKEGFAAIERELALSRGVTIEASNNVYTLRRGASLELAVRSAGPMSTPALVYLMPAGGSGGPGGTTLREFPWHAVSPVEVPPGRSVVVPDLPEDLLHVRVFHAGSRGEPPTTQVRLQAGAVTRHELRLGAAPTIIGRVLREGRPAEGVTVTLEAPDRDHVTTAALDKKPMHAHEVVLPHLPAALQRVVTDGRGAFTFTAYDGLAEGRYVVAETFDGRWRGAALVRAAGVDLTLELAPVPTDGGALRFVFDHFQGLPIEARIAGRPLEPVVLRPGEPFVVEGLELGTWRVHAQWEGEDVIRRQVVEVGAEPAELTAPLPKGAREGQTEDERRRVLGG